MFVWFRHVTTHLTCFTHGDGYVEDGFVCMFILFIFVYMYIGEKRRKENI